MPRKSVQKARRLGAIGLAVIALWLGAPAEAVAAADESPRRAPAPGLVIASWGGAYMEAQQKALGRPWERANGQKIEWRVHTGALGALRRQRAAGRIVWDIVDVLPHEARAGCAEGLLAPLPEALLARAGKRPPRKTDRSGTPHVAKETPSQADDLIVPRPNKCALPLAISSLVAFYKSPRKQARRRRKRRPAPIWKSAPKTIADFFDLKRFPGKRALPRRPNGVLEMALLADGVAPEKIYDVLKTDTGLERAFKRLAPLRKGAIFWRRGAKAVELIENEVARFALGYSARIAEGVAERGLRLAPLWDGQVIEAEWLALAADAPHRAAALSFLHHAAQPERQAALALASGGRIAPARKSAVALLAKAALRSKSRRGLLARLPSAPDNLQRAVIVDPAWWLAHGEEALKRYRAWMAPEAPGR